MDVVALEGDHVVAAGEIDSPVVVAVAGSGPGGGAVDLVVGDGDTTGSLLAEDNVLAGNQVGGDVVDPDHVACNYRLLDTACEFEYRLQLTAVDGDGITTPDELRVDLGETDVLDDDVLDAVGHADTLSFDNTLVALTDKRLVGANSDTNNTSLIISDAGDLGRGLLVVVAPSVLVDGNLACGASAPGTATSRGDLTLTASEVEGLGEDNGAGLVITEVANELSVGLGVDRGGAATTSYTCSRISLHSGNNAKANEPLAKPSAAPLTPSAALTAVARAAAIAAKIEYFITQFLLM